MGGVIRGVESPRGILRSGVDVQVIDMPSPPIPDDFMEAASARHSSRGLQVGPTSSQKWWRRMMGDGGKLRAYTYDAAPGDGGGHVVESYGGKMGLGG